MKKTLISLALVFTFTLPILADDGGDRVKTSDKHQFATVETGNKVREMANETLQETDNKVREMGFSEITLTAFKNFMAFFGA